CGDLYILANLLRFVKRFLLRKSEALYAVSSESLFILPHILFPVKTEFSLPPCRLFRKIKAA
ncbi:hypothetical protein, partial [uncultured Megasphaera sp.]|uniref:hypothetical protein n=1 Tax=uncultured Megasphaera sp. TaxID=165188 RepID=UPI002593F411